MTLYNGTDHGPIHSVDLALKPGALQACVRLRDASVQAAVESRLSSMGYTVTARTMVSGAPMLLVSGPRPASESEWITQLSEVDAPLTPHAEEKPFDAWKVRSLLGFGGQTLQLISSFMKHKVDAPLMLFAGSNLTANVINLRYKAQQRDDPHRLRLLKQAVNDRLVPQVQAGSVLPGIDDTRMLLRGPQNPRPVDAFDEYMQRYSVNIGELGLRYLGAVGMAFPPGGWKTAITRGQLPSLDKNAPLRSVAGIGSIIGKTVALGSTVPDPYNHKPRSWLDSIREKYTFLTGGLVEAGAFSVLAYDALANTAPKKLADGTLDTSRSFKWGGKFHRDWLSGIGAAMFVAGYIVRSWANYGERQVDMNELYAHVSDAIAMLPRQRIAQAMADVSAMLAEHFNQPGVLSFGVIYRAIAEDLYQSHHIALDPSRSVFSEQKATLHHPANDHAVTDGVVLRPGTRIQADTAAQTVLEPSLATAQKR